MRPLNPPRGPSPRPPPRPMKPLPPRLMSHGFFSTTSSCRHTGAELCQLRLQIYAAGVISTQLDVHHLGHDICSRPET